MPRQRKPQQFEVVWLNEPRDEAIFEAQLLLLGWTEGEIARVRRALVRQEAERAGEKVAP